LLQAVIAIANTKTLTVRMRGLVTASCWACMLDGAFLPEQPENTGEAGLVAKPRQTRHDAARMADVTLHDAGKSTFNQRWLVALQDGARVECVLYRSDTLCVSSQVGCAVSCPFCASGAQGLARPLTLAELIGQVEAVRALGHSLQRVTVSGVGEPLHNHAAVWAFFEHCRNERIGVSLTTSGGPIARLAEWLHAPHNGLTLSIHAGSEAMRARMVPKGPSLHALFELLEREVPRMTRRRRKKTALAYLVCGGINDRSDELSQFAERVRPLALPVHLYAYNEVSNSDYKRVSRDEYERCYQQLTDAGLLVRMSSQARLEENGGCGRLLATRSNTRLTALRLT
jgi:23S rRNA (adenine2503-C2)-methyltransferase